MFGLREGSHWVFIILIVAVLFGGKRLPDAARYFGRSLRVFKSEMKEMKSDEKSPEDGNSQEGTSQK